MKTMLGRAAAVAKKMGRASDDQRAFVQANLVAVAPSPDRPAPSQQSRASRTATGDGHQGRLGVLAAEARRLQAPRAHQGRGGLALVVSDLSANNHQQKIVWVLMVDRPDARITGPKQI